MNYKATWKLLVKIIKQISVEHPDIQVYKYGFAQYRIGNRHRDNLFWTTGAIEYLIIDKNDGFVTFVGAEEAHIITIELPEDFDYSIFDKADKA